MPRRLRSLTSSTGLRAVLIDTPWAAFGSAATLGRAGLRQNQRSAPRFVVESRSAAAAVAEAIGTPVGLLFDVFRTRLRTGATAMPGI